LFAITASVVRSEREEAGEDRPDARDISGDLLFVQQLRDRRETRIADLVWLVPPPMSTIGDGRCAGSSRSSNDLNEAADMQAVGRGVEADIGVMTLRVGQRIGAPQVRALCMNPRATISRRKSNSVRAHQALSPGHACSRGRVM